MSGKKTLRVLIACPAFQHPFWLASIQNECVTGLDLLAKRGPWQFWVLLFGTLQ